MEKSTHQDDKYHTLFYVQMKHPFFNIRCFIYIEFIQYLRLFLTLFGKLTYQKATDRTDQLLCLYSNPLCEIIALR